MSTGIPEQDKLNVDKYGEKEHDIISQAYRESKKAGDIYVIFNCIKYLKRFVGRSAKSENLMDLLKVRDYLERAIEKAQEQVNASDSKLSEVIEKMPVTNGK